MTFSTNFKQPKGSARLDRKARKAEEDAALAAAYEIVNQRDANLCRVTGRFLSPSSVMAETRREHHHLQPRSIAPDRIADPSNIILVAAEVHQLITGGFIEIEGKDATKALFAHWNEAAMKGRIKPFRIVGKRTAA
jgi:hypothetical protein